MRLFLPTSLLALLFSASACGDDAATPTIGAADTTDTLHDTTTPADTTADTAGPDDAATRPDLGGGEGVANADLAVTTVLPDGTTRRTVLDAADTTAWLHFDLRTGAGVAPNDPTTDEDWVLAVQRYRVRANGGTSGPLGVAVTHADGDVDTITEAAAEGWREDDDTKTDTDGETLYAFAVDGGWYDYDPVNHVLTPKEGRVYFVRVPAESGDRFFKLRFRDYYDESGNAGVVTVDWAPVAAPPATLPEGAFRVASGKVDLDAGEAATAEGAWDLELGVGGTVAIATAHGALAVAAEWEALTETDTVGFVNDDEMPAPGPPGSPLIRANAEMSGWYDYNPMTHQVTPKEGLAWIVRRLDGTYRAVRILGYSDGEWVVQAKAVTRAPKAHSLTVEAPSAAGLWQHVDLAAGQVVEGGDGAWDLAVLGVNARTNSGTSGDGLGGAVLTDAATLEALAEAPEEGWVEDAMAPLPGPPGSGEVSANAALGTWYNYDPVTDAVSSKGGIYALRLHDGTVAKLRVDAYASGTWTLSWVYAGPGTTSF